MGHSEADEPIAVLELDRFRLRCGIGHRRPLDYSAANSIPCQADRERQTGRAGSDDYYIRIQFVGHD